VLTGVAPIHVETVITTHVYVLTLKITPTSAVQTGHNYKKTFKLIQQNFGDLGPLGRPI